MTCRGVVVFAIFVTVVISAATRCSAEQRLPKFDGGRAYEDLRQMVLIGPRPAGSPAIEKTRDYIKKQLVAAGVKPEEQPFDAQTPVGVIHMVNIRATLPGQTRDRGSI